MTKRALKSSYSKYNDNVMNPLKWTTIAFEAFFSATLWVTNQFWIQIVCFLFMATILSVYFGIYIFWALRDPSRLQSEGFNLEEAAMISSNDKSTEIKLENNKSDIK